MFDRQLTNRKQYLQCTDIIIVYVEENHPQMFFHTILWLHSVYILNKWLYFVIKTCLFHPISVVSNVVINKNGSLSPINIILWSKSNVNPIENYSDDNDCRDNITEDARDSNTICSFTQSVKDMRLNALSTICYYESDKNYCHILPRRFRFLATHARPTKY